MRHFIRKLWDAYSTFRNIIFEGHYNGHAHIDHLLNDEHPACSAEEKAGQRAFGLTVFIGGDILLNVAYAVLSYTALGVVSLAASVAGAAFYAHEFFRCRRRTQQEIEEVNLAGQKVSGLRGDLCRLHLAQTRIIDLTLEYNSAAAEGLRHILKDKIDQTIAGVSGEVSRVHVLDGGKYYPGAATYQFEQVARHRQHLSLQHRRHKSHYQKTSNQKDLALVSMHRSAQS